ncbi:MAG: thioredoxin family protein [Bacteroidales bacterium]|nr:thioredoxin family protein [Bacteroidales bacterium]
MKLLRTLILVFLFILPISLIAQEKEKEKVYNTELDGMEQLDDAIKMAKESNKHVLVQVGGNWCPWCIRFHNYSKDDPDINKMIKDNYIVVKLNMSPENKNEKALARLEKPGRFGYPVFVILDSRGKRVHTQDSGLLEQDKGYDKRKVLTFLKGWAPGSF